MNDLNINVANAQAHAPTPAPALDTDWRPRAEFEVFHIHFARWRAAIIGAVVLTLVVGGIFFYLTRNEALWWWIALQSGGYLLQGICCRIYENNKPEFGSARFAHWMWVWIVLTAATGMLSGALAFWVPTDQIVLLLATVMVSGTFSIGEASAGGHEKLVYAAVLSQAVTTCAVLVLHAGLPLGVIVSLLFAASVVHFGRELNRSMVDNMAQGLRAQQLVRELELGQQRLLDAQHQQSVLRERQRVMQDMHDGLGSALSSSLVMLERGELDVGGAAVVMRECIDDLRLVVDSLEPTAQDLSTLLGMLRYRLQHRIAAAGVQLRWQMADLPQLHWLEPSLALDLLRLMQEAIANALKHAGATELTLAIRPLTATASERFETIELLVCDNGRGFDPIDLAAAGRGLRTMQSRALRLQAELSILSNPGSGTTIGLRLPVRLGELQI